MERSERRQFVPVREMCRRVWLLLARLCGRRGERERELMVERERERQHTL